MGISMVKDQVTVTIDRDVLKRVEQVGEEAYPGASRSYVVETLLRSALAEKRYKLDISVVR